MSSSVHVQHQKPAALAPTNNYGVVLFLKLSKSAHSGAKCSLLSSFFWNLAALCDDEARKEKALTIRCPTCGAKPGQKCELSTGLPRTEPHRDRRLEAPDK